MKSPTLRCFRCLKTPEQIGEYADAAEAAGMTPDEYVLEEESTYNPHLNLFCCTECYIAIGMPSAPAPVGWKVGDPY